MIQRATLSKDFPDNSNIFNAYGTLIRYSINAEKQFYAAKSKARDTTTPEMISALQDEYPKPIYWPVGNMLIPGSVIPTVLALLPDRLVDRTIFIMW